jgi:hypothetical protein
LEISALRLDQQRVKAGFACTVSVQGTSSKATMRNHGIRTPQHSTRGVQA